MLRMRFWPMTARPINAMSPLGSMIKFVKRGSPYKSQSAAPEDSCLLFQYDGTGYRRGRQTVAFAPDFLDPLRPLAVVPEFFPQAINVRVHRARGGEIGVAPDGVENLFARHRLADAFREQIQQRKFRFRELQRRA